VKATRLRASGEMARKGRLGVRRWGSRENPRISICKIPERIQARAGTIVVLDSSSVFPRSAIRATLARDSRL
jgi:hypothetical protein